MKPITLVRKCKCGNIMSTHISKTANGSSISIESLNSSCMLRSRPGSYSRQLDLKDLLFANCSKCSGRRDVSKFEQVVAE